MNLLECTVTEVLSKPFEDYGRWWVKVKYDCYSVPSETQIMFDTKEESKKVEVGFKFMA